MPMFCSTMARSPAVTCSPAATTVSYSRASCRTEAPRQSATSLLVSPAMAETTTATSLPAFDLALHVPRDVADAVEVGDRRPAEFHDKPGHAVKISVRRAPDKPVPPSRNAGNIGGFPPIAGSLSASAAAGQQPRGSRTVAGRQSICLSGDRMTKWQTWAGRSDRAATSGGHHAQGRGDRRKHPQGLDQPEIRRGPDEACRGEARLRDAPDRRPAALQPGRRGEPPPAVVRFKGEIKAADGVLFVTPEHNRSIPAAMKNAIDWATRPPGKNAFSRQGRGDRPAPRSGRISTAVGAAASPHDREQPLLRPSRQPRSLLELSRTSCSTTTGNVIDEATRKLLHDLRRQFRPARRRNGEAIARNSKERSDRDV